MGARVGDRPDNGNRRYALAEEINAAYDGTGPMWGRPASWHHPRVPLRRQDRHGAHPPDHRRTEARGTQAKSVWQLAYAGAVGSQVLLGLPVLKALREDPVLRDRLQVWPFDTGLEVPGARICMAEIYPALVQRAVRARRGADEILDAAQVRVLAGAFAALDARGGLAPLFAGPAEADAADRAAICAEEGWILGLDHGAALEAALAAADVPARAARACREEAEEAGAP